MVTVTAYIALGSNLGDRQTYLDNALVALGEQPGIVVCRVSSYHETAPVGGPPGQGSYLNAAAELQTDLDPESLLRVLLTVEQNLGRARQERHGPRTIDLDLLLHDQTVLHGPELVVPHPRMHERRFVLAPLAELAASAVHPILRLTIQELLDRLPHELQPGGPGRELTGLRAMVTGSSSGIGRAIARELASAGAGVFIHRRNPRSLPLLAAEQARQEAQKVADELRVFGVQAQVLMADLHDAEECRQLVRSAWAAWQGIDIWINNAGADTLTGEAAHWSFEQKLEALLAVDVRASILLSRDVGRRMKAQGGGVLLNMGWDQAETGMEGDSGELFAATKGAVMAFTKSLALSLAPEVRVNCLAPGWIRTRWGENASASWQERVERETPLGRWGKPEDVAATARWLVSPSAAFITGQVIRINGGAVR
jgi:3-oxoacyl-[acyl-carrier protein] reductase